MKRHGVSSKGGGDSELYGYDVADSADNDGISASGVYSATDDVDPFGMSDHAGAEGDPFGTGNISGGDGDDGGEDDELFGAAGLSMGMGMPAVSKRRV